MPTQTLKLCIPRATVASTNSGWNRDTQRRGRIVITEANRDTPVKYTQHNEDIKPQKKRGTHVLVLTHRLGHARRQRVGTERVATSKAEGLNRKSISKTPVLSRSKHARPRFRNNHRNLDTRLKHEVWLNGNDVRTAARMFRPAMRSSVAVCDSS